MYHNHGESCGKCHGHCGGRCHVTDDTVCGRCARIYAAHNHEGGAVYCPLDLTFVAADDQIAVEVRPVLSDFVIEMEKRLQSFDELRGPRGWLGDAAVGLTRADPLELADRLEEKLDELRWALANGEPTSQILTDATDIANYAMMIADIYVDVRTDTEIESMAEVAAQVTEAEISFARAQAWLKAHFAVDEATLDATDLAALIREVRAEYKAQVQQAVDDVVAEADAEEGFTFTEIEPKEEPDGTTFTFTATPPKPSETSTSSKRPLQAWLETHSFAQKCRVCGGVGYKLTTDLLLPDGVTPLPQRVACRACEGSGKVTG